MGGCAASLGMLPRPRYAPAAAQAGPAGAARHSPRLEPCNRFQPFAETNKLCWSEARRKVPRNAGGGPFDAMQEAARWAGEGEYCGGAAEPVPPGRTNSGESIVDVLTELVWVDHVFLFLKVRDLKRLDCTCRALHELLERGQKHVWRAIAAAQERATLGSGHALYLGALERDSRQALPAAACRDVHVDNMDWREIVERSDRRLLTGGGPLQEGPDLPVSRWRRILAKLMAGRETSRDRGDQTTRRRSAGGASEGAGGSGRISSMRLREELLQASPLSDLEGPAQHIFGGHSPHLHWLGGTQVLAFAGNFYPDGAGGSTPLDLEYVYEFDVSQTPVRLVDTVHYRADPASGRWPHGAPHPQIMGAASAVWNCKVIFFGGGSPMNPQKINNQVTQFDILARRWHTLWKQQGAGGGATASPNPRQVSVGCQARSSSLCGRSPQIHQIPQQILRAGSVPKPCVAISHRHETLNP